MATKICSKCNKEVEDISVYCPSCGCLIEDRETSEIIAEPSKIEIVNTQSQTAEIIKMKKSKYIGIVVCFIGAILLLSALIPVTSSKHKYYVENYDYYMSQYKETGSRASDFGGGGILGGGYSSLSSRWKGMADEAMKRIWIDRIIAIVLVASGGIAIKIGYKKTKTSRG